MNKQSIPEMIEWCRRIGYEVRPIMNIRIERIAGLKGRCSHQISTTSDLFMFQELKAKARLVHLFHLY